MAIGSGPWQSPGRVCALDERADPHGDVLGESGRPRLRLAQRGEHRAERVDHGLVYW